MNTIRRAEQTTTTEAIHVGIPPWIVSDFCCKCGQSTSCRAYGLEVDLVDARLICQKCAERKETENNDG